jgi:DNA-binding transcriptional regulator YhcF (GntR family)
LGPGLFPECDGGIETGIETRTEIKIKTKSNSKTNSTAKAAGLKAPALHLSQRQHHYMEISITKNSEVPLREQLAEQIVIAIATGQVRALARRVKIHHNTVSEAYQDLVRRKWLVRRPGKRLVVGERMDPARRQAASLDDLIDETIERARVLGFSLQALRQRVRERLLAQAPDHILVVAEEEGLRILIREEVRRNCGVTVEICSPEEFAADPGRRVGAQVFAPAHLLDGLEARFAIPITYSKADEHAGLIRGLKKPSIVAAVSVSESLLVRARAMFAAAVGRRHTYREILVTGKGRVNLAGVDLAFCDSVSFARVDCRKKVPYLLVSSACMKQFAGAVELMRKA